MMNFRIAVRRSWDRSRLVGLALYGGVILGSMGHRSVAQPSSPSSPAKPASTSAIDLDPNLIQTSPTLRKWLDHTPDVLQEIRNDPSFRSRLRLGYARFPKSNEDGWTVGLEDWRIGQTPLTVSASYSASFDATQQAIAADLHLYALPLGSSINVAPIVGYRSLKFNDNRTSGMNLGGRLLLVPSRGGGADISLDASWLNPGTDQEVGLARLSFGYAITPQLRIATDFERWNQRSGNERRAGILLEWMPKQP